MALKFSARQSLYSREIAFGMRCATCGPDKYALCSKGPYHLSRDCKFAHKFKERVFPTEVEVLDREQIWYRDRDSDGKALACIDWFYGQHLSKERLELFLWYARAEEDEYPEDIQTLLWYVGGLYGLGNYDDWQFWVPILPLLVCCV